MQPPKIKIASAERAAYRENMRDLYEMGLQSTPSKAGFPETPKAKEVKRRPRRKPRRTVQTYRAQRVNSHRSSRAKFLKAERVANGETRSQADRRRWETAQSA